MDIGSVADDIKTIEQEQAEGAAAAYIGQEHTAEEEAANRAAAELQQRKKRRKRRNRILAVLAIVLIAVGVVGYRRYQAYQTAQAEEEANVLALADGEELTYGEITQVVGNDITVAVVEEDTSSSSEDVNAKAPDEGVPASGDSSANISTEDDTTDGNPAAGDVANSDVAGGAPSGNGVSGGASGGGAGDAPSMPDGADAAGGMPGGSAPSGMDSMSRTTYTETGETKEYQVPVGTQVTTMLGATTTFAKLKAGNVIGVVTQAGTNNILRIKIVQ